MNPEDFADTSPNGKHCQKCWGTGLKIDHARAGVSVRLIREGRGVSLADAARALGVSEPYLSLLERGKRTWTYRMYCRSIRVVRSIGKSSKPNRYGQKPRPEDNY